MTSEDIWNRVNLSSYLFNAMTYFQSFHNLIILVQYYIYYYSRATTLNTMISVTDSNCLAPNQLSTIVIVLVSPMLNLNLFYLFVLVKEHGHSKFTTFAVIVTYYMIFSSKCQSFVSIFHNMKVRMHNIPSFASIIGIEFIHIAITPDGICQLIHKKCH